MEIDCYAAMSAGQPLERFRYEPRDPAEHEVGVSIECCGLCRDDLHYRDNELGLTRYPFVPGHEIVGRVAARGRRVTGVKEGDRVGIGWQGGSCGECAWCVRGDEQDCGMLESHLTFSPYGGFAASIVVDGRFAFPLPDGMKSGETAPLLCAGAAAYAAFGSHDVRPSMAVGIVGVGAMGHLAIQFARAFGCEVTAFSSTPGKRGDARELGAHRFLLLDDEDGLSRMVRSLDFILSTVPAGPDVNAFIPLLRRGGAFCAAGFRTSPVRRETMREMLSFAQAQGIAARIEIMPMERVNEAIAKLGENGARYAIVLKN